MISHLVRRILTGGEALMLYAVVIITILGNALR